MNGQRATWYAKTLIRNILKYKIELAAKLSGKIFACGVLQGTSTYNLAINSDMTVSCNCQDFDGSGKLGDLSCNNLEEILSGEKANTFRKTLATGKLPILNCARCVELKKIPREQAADVVNFAKVSNKNIMVENTILCGCNCLSCARKQVMSNRKKLALTIEDITCVATEIKKHNIKSVAYFNLGDPFISPNILQEIKIIKKHNPNIFISTSTNGLYLDSASKFEAALMIDDLIVSIDGVDTKMVRKYQQNGSFEQSFNNMCALAKYRDERNLKKPCIVWNYVLFNWNDKPAYINEAIRLARIANIDRLSICHTKTPFWGISWRWYTNRFFRSKTQNQPVQYIHFDLKSSDKAAQATT